jgi:tetratricopeptide (TPR) repeat protein
MKPSRHTTAVVSTLLVAFLAGSVTLLRHLDTLRAAAPVEEVLYITSPKLLKRMSLGYDGLLADVYWTRAIQYFGEHHHRGAESYALLAPLLELTTALDPHLVVAYDFGANFLAPAPPDGAGLPDRALKLVQHGIENNPDNWKLYYQLGFIYDLQLKNYAAAADAFARGSRVADAHPVMQVLAAKMAQHAGDSQMARALWTTTYNTTHDKQIRANAVAHLRALQSDDTVVALEKLAAQFREQTGHFPASFNDMIASGLLQGTPVDPAGHTYQLLPQGKVELRVPDDLPFSEKGLPPGYKPLNRIKPGAEGS